MTKLLDVNVTIGQLNPDTNNSYNATFAPADTANSNLVLPEGTLNLQSVEEDVLIRWTLVAGTTHQFWTANSAPSGATDAGWNETQPNWAFQWRPKNPGNPGQEPNSGWTTSGRHPPSPRRLSR